VDLSGLSKSGRDMVLAILRDEPCTCGCNQKIAECRMKDQSCSASRRLANFVIQGASAGKQAGALREELKKYAGEPPPLLEKPVKLSTDGNPARGPANAKVTIVEFSDFQCPYCAIATVEVAQLLKEYPKDVRVVFKQFPLDIHSQAALAAEASLAAHAQGKFWELHDKMYADYRQISRVRILAWAKEIGLDLNRFLADLDGHKYAARVTAEERQGEAAGVEGTPTFFINGKKLNAAFEVSTLAPIIADELKH
jgi:protein-disulfide isomerase